MIDIKRSTVRYFSSESPNRDVSVLPTHGFIKRLGDVLRYKVCKHRFMCTSDYECIDLSRLLARDTQQFIAEIEIVN